MDIMDILNKECPVPYKRTRDMSQSEYMKLVDRNAKLVDKIKEQQERINRAIEYIKSNDNYFLSDSYMKILEILKGEGKE